MTHPEIVEQIKNLPPNEQWEVVETILQLIKETTQKPRKKLGRKERNRQMETAAKLLLDDYLHDPEQTIFTVLDTEDFYD